MFLLLAAWAAMCAPTVLNSEVNQRWVKGAIKEGLALPTGPCSASEFQIEIIPRVDEFSYTVSSLHTFRR